VQHWKCIVWTSTGQASLSPSGDVLCRRCGKSYLLPEHSVRFASCPHCGAAARPLWRWFRNNGNAAIFALIAILVLSIGIVAPCISVSELGQQHAYSLIDGIEQLFARGNYFLATLLLAFSVIFPYAKLLAILICTSRLAPLSAKTRHRLHWLASVTGRYSLLDILVVAIIIVVIKFDDVAEAKALAGTYWFCAAVFVSMASGLCVWLDSASEVTA